MVFYSISYSQDRKIYETIFEHTGVTLFGLSLVIGISLGEYRNLRASYRIWLVLLGIDLILMMLIGIANQYMNFGSRRYVTYMDLGAFCFLSGIIVASNKRNWPILHRTILQHFCVGSVLCFFSLILSKTLLSEELIRSSTYVIANLLYAWPYLLFQLPNLEPVKKIIVSAGLCLFIVLSILFLKRTPIIQMLVLFFAFTFVRQTGCWGKRVHSLVKQSAVFAFVGGFAILVIFAMKLEERYGFGMGTSGFRDRLYHVDNAESTSNLLDTFLQNYRWSYEPRAVLENASLMEILFGQGIGSVIMVDQHISISGETSVLHNTLMEQVLKGGIVYLALWNVGWIMAIKYFFRSGDTALIPFGTVAFMTILLSWTASFLSIGLAAGMVMVCGGRLMSVEQKQTRSKQRTIHSGQKPCLH